VDYKKLDDEALMRLIALTQEQALGTLYDRYNRLVYSMALNTTGDPGLAEEITQDVFLRVWNKAETYRPEQGKVVTWMSSITRYRAIDLLRQRGIRPEANRLDWADGVSPDLPDEVDVEFEVEVAQRRQRVRMALAQLPPEQRQALAYAFFQGYSHSQIAEALSEPLGTVKTRIRLAMQKLRQILYEDKLPNE
jgi:RNA polymerase sigma-70 factor (ECF subfamily)